MGIARGIAGQIMCSVIPSRIRNKDGSYIELAGLGSPALTEYQDAAVTFYIEYNEQGRPVGIVARRKYKQEIPPTREADYRKLLLRST
jgi:hypothetical protein